MTITPKEICDAGFAISMSEARRLMFMGAITESCKKCGFRKDTLKDNCKACGNEEFELKRKKKN